jgi:hypothetical protein
LRGAGSLVKDWTQGDLNMLTPRPAIPPALETPAAQITLEQVLTDHLSDEDLENLLCVFLQSRFGYLVRTGSARGDAAAGEYVLRNAVRNEAVVRARHGHVTVPRDSSSLRADAVDNVFVFSPTNTYGPDPAPNVIEIDYDDLVDFIRTERWSLPRSVEDWVSQALDTD